MEMNNETKDILDRYEITLMKLGMATAQGDEKAKKMYMEQLGDLRYLIIEKLSW